MSSFDFDKQQIGRHFNRIATGYDRSAQVSAEIANRLLERLDLVRLQPQRILDLGCGTGHGAQALLRRYPGAEVIAMDLSAAMAASARRSGRFWQRRPRVAVADAEQLPLTGQCVELLFSSLMLPWCNDLDQTFREFHRITRPGGLLMFTSLGPDTLIELRRSWQQIDTGTHVHPFLDMHDIGDALIRAGWADPVMDVEHLTVTYPDFATLLAELRGQGGGNLARDRSRGLLGRQRWQRLADTYLRQYGIDQRLPVSCEIVYGHAWRGDTPGRDGEVRIPLSQLKRRSG